MDDYTFFDKSSEPDLMKKNLHSNKKNSVEDSTITTGRDAHVGDKNTTNFFFNFGNIGIAFLLILLIIVLVFQKCLDNHSVKKTAKLSISLVDINNNPIPYIEGSFVISSENYSENIEFNKNEKIHIIHISNHLIGDSVTIELESTDWEISDSNNRFLLTEKPIKLLIEEKKDHVKIEGVVIDLLTHLPVEGVEVVVNGTAIKSDESGTFTFNATECIDSNSKYEIALKKKGYEAKELTYDCNSELQNLELEISKAKIEKPKLVALFTGSFEAPPKDTKAIFGNDTLPLAFIDDAYEIGNEGKAMINADACVYTFTFSNSSEQPVFIENIYIRVEKYQELGEYEVHQKFSFKESKIAYIHIGKAIGKEYPVSFYVIDGQRKDFGKLSLVPGEHEIVSIRINAKYPGVYTFDCFAFAKRESDGATQELKLFNAAKWVFDKE